MTGKNPLGNGKEPQSYEGLNVIVPVGGWRLVRSLRDPTTSDLKYPIGALWVNTANNSMWALVRAVSGSATWEILTGNTTISAVSGTTQQMVVNQGYIPGNAALTTLTLPATATVGSSLNIIGSGAGGWTIAQNAGQQIVMNSQSTTAGTGGSLSSTNKNNCVELVATVGGASTVWTVSEASGTLTFV